MNTISPHYRNDSVDGLDAQMRDDLDENFFNQLDYVNEKNPRLLVVFAGGNAVGKSTLSAKLSSTFHGLQIENDQIKRILLKRHPELAKTDELHNITWRYTMDLYRRLPSVTNNGLIIRDGIITWYYDRILPIFQEQGYEIFIIGYNLSDAKMRELIKNRGDTATSTEQRFYDLIEDQKIHLARFFEHYQADVMLDDNTVFDHERVVSSLRSKLTKIKL